ncbi:WD40-repeat-containing domain protein [Dipodascopsis tothii]|uniref:WD40-repeat-containing domain protein n=1 Tax=Dipodascopsis tothii TaxID=44089 RepID=UPI0034CF30B7
MLSSYLLTRESAVQNALELRSAQLGRQYAQLVRSTTRYFPVRHNGTVNSLAIDASGRYMISGGSDSGLAIWDLNGAAGRRHRYAVVGSLAPKRGHRYGIAAASWWPFDTGMFVTSSFDETVKVWDTNAMEEVYTFEMGARVNSHDLSPTGAHSLVACAADSPAIRLLDLRTTAAAQTLVGHARAGVIAVRWSPTNEHMLASGGADGTVRLWDIRRSQACLAVLDLETTGLHTGGAAAATSAAWGAGVSHRGAVNGLLWFDDGTRLVSAGNDEAVRVWDLRPSSRALRSASNGIINTLVNFGPLIQNRYMSAVSMVLTPARDCRAQLLFFPSDSGDLMVFNVATGRLVSRLSSTAGQRRRKVAGLACRGMEYVEIFSGNSEGDIILWEPATGASRSKSRRRDDDAEAGGRKKPNVLAEIYRGLDVE